MQEVSHVGEGTDASVDGKVDGGIIVQELKYPLVPQRRNATVLPRIHTFRPTLSRMNNEMRNTRRRIDNRFRVGRRTNTTHNGDEVLKILITVIVYS